MFMTELSQKMPLLSSELLHLTLNRLCQQLIENHDQFEATVLVGMQPRGRFFADRIKKRLDQQLGINVPIGYLDTTFYRDDFRRRPDPLRASETNMPFLVENKRVILIDDVLYTGRTVRAALAAMAEFGRPAGVELLVLIDRQYSRDLPIQADYAGSTVNTIQSQRVVVEWMEQGFTTDAIWLVNN
jgi:pyrimidine operon attenuation protein/uracil phosphoribosyltransferase